VGAIIVKKSIKYIFVSQLLVNFEISSISKILINLVLHL